MANSARPVPGSQACLLGRETLTALIERIVASEQFHKSPRAQELFRYLCDRVLKDPTSPITEHEVGVALYGWDRDKDPGTDTIVRVQVSHLRKKLEHYFVTEGRNEPVGIRISRGSYAPAFEVRELAPSEQAGAMEWQQEATAEIRSVPPKTPGKLRTVLIACIFTAIFVGGSFEVLLRQKAPANPPSTPALDRFWSGFRNGAGALMVLSDTNLIVFADILGHMVPLNDYRHNGYPSRELATVKDPEVRRVAENLLGLQNTGFQDATTVSSISLLLSRYHVPAGSISARDFRMPQPENLILLGHPKANPWVRFFEEPLNFRYQFDFEKHRGSIVNRAPAAGEQDVYTATFGNVGYCVVACLPKPEGSGSVMLIFGSDVSSLQAGGAFVCDEGSLQKLYQRIGSAPSRAPTHIEVFLKTYLLDNLARRYEIVAYRIPAS